MSIIRLTTLTGLICSKITTRWTHSFRRPPVVTIMGHVDHGKTTLLDHLRNSQITSQEFGGITQHIGAFVVPFKNEDKSVGQKEELVTFLDTPGHAAFAAMRKRGAIVTDIVVLVIACEDGVLDQTEESIKYAKDAEVPIIVAVNKIDKFGDEKELNKAIDAIKQQLLINDVITEADNGEVQLIKMSALKGFGVDDLKQSILALAETLDLTADPEANVKGRVIESGVDKYRGKICTILIQDGTLKKGNCLLAGKRNWARVRALFDERNRLKQYCGPGLPIQVTGWREEQLPAAGDIVEQAPNEAMAKKIIHEYYEQSAQEKAARDHEAAAKREEEHRKIYQEKLKEKRESGYMYRPIYDHPRGFRPKQPKFNDPSDTKKLNLVLKCDVDGSLDAILSLLDTYDPHNNQLVKLDIMHYGVGNITDSDITLASVFNNSIIYGFNVKTDDQSLMLRAKREGAKLKLFNVIYHLIDDLKLRLTERMPELDRDLVIGQAAVIERFLINDKKRKIQVAGSRCTKGTLKKDLFYKIIRQGEEIIRDLKVGTLKHFKEDVKEITKGQEFGISFIEPEQEPEAPILMNNDPTQFTKIQKKTLNCIDICPSDIIVAYEKYKVKPKLKWDLRGFG